MTPCSWVDTNLLSILRMETLVPIQMLRKPLNSKLSNCIHPKPSRQSMTRESCLQNYVPLRTTKLNHVKIPYFPRCMGPNVSWDNMHNPNNLEEHIHGARTFQRKVSIPHTSISFHSCAHHSSPCM